MPSDKRKPSTTAVVRRYSIGGDAKRRSLSWGDADADSILRAIESVTDASDALLFGRTTDGGALSLRVLSGGETYAEYFATLEDANDALQAITLDAKRE